MSSRIDGFDLQNEHRFTDLDKIVNGFADFSKTVDRGSIAISTTDLGF